MRTVTDDIASALAAPDTSRWLREALRLAIERDPIDAANDAERLADLLTGRVEAMISLDEWRQLCTIDSLPLLDLTDPKLRFGGVLSR